MSKSAIEAILALLSTAGDREIGDRAQSEYWVVTRPDWLFGGSI